KRICACWKGGGCPSPAKHPIASLNGHRLAAGGYLDGSTEAGILKLWWSIAPDANLGIWCRNLIVLDTDPRHRGDDALADLEREHPLPATWRVITGSLGQHIYFRAPEGTAIRSWRAEDAPYFGPGIDGRANDGYVVVPPSIHISGRRYEWSVDHHPRDVEL